MASGICSTRRDALISWLVRPSTDSAAITAAAVSTTETDIRLALTSTGTTLSAPGTEITGTGYTAGGKIADFGAVSSGASSASGPDTASVFRWDNSSGGPWTIDGALLHDNAGTFPTNENQAMAFANGLNYTVQDGEGFEIADGGVTLTIANTA